MTAKAGEIMIHPPNQSFSEISQSKGVHQWIGFDAFSMENMELFDLYPVPYVLRLEDVQPFSEEFSRLHTLWKNETLPLREIKMMTSAYSLICMVLDSWESSGRILRNGAYQGQEKKFSQVIQHMDQHLHEKLSREDFARMVNLHPVYLDRIFFESYGMTPMQMLRYLRMEKAKKMLSNPEHSIAEIADQCGFHDVLYFSRHFGRKFGLSPGRYRQNLKLAREHYH